MLIHYETGEFMFTNSKTLEIFIKILQTFFHSQSILKEFSLNIKILCIFQVNYTLLCCDNIQFRSRTTMC